MSLSDKAEETGESKSLMVKVMNQLKDLQISWPKIVHFKYIIQSKAEQKKELELISSWRFCAGEESLH